VVRSYGKVVLQGRADAEAGPAAKRQAFGMKRHAFGMKRLGMKHLGMKRLG
jgi:hypothetical protein